LDVQQVLSDDSRGCNAVVDGNPIIEPRGGGTESNFGEIGFSGIKPLKIND
jgi:hypothetical protein